jgi:hypothetical protein
LKPTPVTRAQVETIFSTCAESSGIKPVARGPPDGFSWAADPPKMSRAAKPRVPAFKTIFAISPSLAVQVLFNLPPFESQARFLPGYPPK